MVRFLATDGGYRASTNIGAWAFVVEGDISIVDFGTEEGTTNQKMELKAIIEALKYAKTNFPNEEIEVLSDSAYCVNGMNQRWFDKWILNRWLNSKSEPVKNKELWQELIDLDKELDVKYVKVKGHNGDELNEMADFEVNRAMDLWEKKHNENI